MHGHPNYALLISILLLAPAEQPLYISFMMEMVETLYSITSYLQLQNVSTIVQQWATSIILGDNNPSDCPFLAVCGDIFCHSVEGCSSFQWQDSEVGSSSNSPIHRSLAWARVWLPIWWRSSGSVWSVSAAFHSPPEAIHVLVDWGFMPETALGHMFHLGLFWGLHTCTSCPVLNW